jgi:hypothetical protein
VGIEEIQVITHAASPFSLRLVIVTTSPIIVVSSSPIAVETAEMKTHLQFGETQSKPIILPLGGTQLESE